MIQLCAMVRYNFSDEKPLTTSAFKLKSLIQSILPKQNVSKDEALLRIRPIIRKLLL